MEIRNITPMNTTPAFGMAFKAPKEEHMVQLIDYLLDSGLSSREANKALKGLQKAHANDVHFDFRYTGGDAFEITPKSEKAKEMYDSGKIIFQPQPARDELGAMMYDRADRCETVCVNRLRGKKGIKKFFAKVANFIDRKILAFDRYTDPSTALPGKMRDISAQVRTAEATVNKRLSDEAIIRAAFPSKITQESRALADVVEIFEK